MLPILSHLLWKTMGSWRKINFTDSYEILTRPTAAAVLTKLRLVKPQSASIRQLFAKLTRLKFQIRSS